MQKLLLLGDEAIAQAAIDAGLSAIYAYPGTPSTEINEYIYHSREAKEKGIISSWVANEKTAMEAALGVSYAGKRAMTAMKHVGLNVAADPFMNSAITGANGGLLFVACDDPSMHSSQNEQDSRCYGKFALLPILEPANQQEAYDMTRFAFDFSEKYGVPVLMRLTTRLAHSRAGVARSESREQNPLSLPANHRQFILLPVNARRQYKKLLGQFPEFERESEVSGFNSYEDGPDTRLGIIACGIAYNYLKENYPGGKVPHPLVKVGMYPCPKNHITRLYESCDEILVLEDGHPLIEELLRGMLSRGKSVHGRLDGFVPRDGELNPSIVAKALGFAEVPSVPVPDVVVGRPPSLCGGCPHIYTYNALNEALTEYAKGRVFSDIGCYTLGALEPFDAINTCVDMGASITMAKGAADVGLSPAVAVIGDSTFTHSGITGLLDCVNDGSNVKVLILDNATTAMTGGQPSAATGRIEAICKGLGVEDTHIIVLNPSPKYHEENLAIMKKELEYQGVSVIIPRRECIQTATKRKKSEIKAKKAEL
ncbi:MAG TPA: thiamine pyrophosphate-dependent enzyme [Bacteroidales bacterium]|nr:thiamine pyrophosphate-dependent enzyme [Bacteroidales bacterium]HSA44125.1 thiamine pyrophosphate-dependent enzyme [Bacteroidales bacterium]